MGLCAVLITKNEEHQIRRCLDSLKSWVDEIIIVDDQSTDNTAAIARNEYGAHVIINPLNNQFDQQRNIGIKASTQEWIIKIDADEVVPPHTAQKISNAIHQAGPVCGFEILLRDCYLNVPLKHVGNMYQLKIYKKANAYYKGIIHESLNVQGDRGRIESEILHYPMKSVSAMFAKHNFYTDLQVLQLSPEDLKRDYCNFHQKIVWKILKVFYKHYVKHKGYQDGIPGLMWSMIHTINPALFWLKVIEKSYNIQHNT